MLHSMFVLALGFESERPGAHTLHSGRLAQLGERRVRNAEVGSSILPPSTNTFLTIPSVLSTPDQASGSTFRFAIGIPLGSVAKLADVFRHSERIHHGHHGHGRRGQRDVRHVHRHRLVFRVNLVGGRFTFAENSNLTKDFLAPLSARAASSKGLMASEANLKRRSLRRHASCERSGRSGPDQEG